MFAEERRSAHSRARPTVHRGIRVGRRKSCLNGPHSLPTRRRFHEQRRGKNSSHLIPKLGGQVARGPVVFVVVVLFVQAAAWRPDFIGRKS